MDNIDLRILLVISGSIANILSLLLRTNKSLHEKDLKQETETILLLEHDIITG